MTRTLLTLITLLAIQPLFAQVKIAFGDLQARNIGPAVMSGRVSDVDAVHSKPKQLYVGTANGGVWRSNDGGANFNPIFDDYTQSIGKIAIDQAHPDTIWVGTGESWVRNSVSVGTGIYLTTNGGKTWSHKGLEDTERISNIAIHPENSAVIYAAAQGHLWNSNEERGIYKSEDFGETWARIFYIDENTGCADLTMDPNNPDILYAAMWEHRRSADFFTSGGGESGLYKTTDGGRNWTKVRNGLPTGKLGRIAVDIAPSNSKVIYATVEAEEKEDKGLYRSRDGGKRFELVNSDFNTTVRPFYFSRLVVDPTNEDKIFKCGLNLTVSEDGGESFRTVGSGVHSDIHAVWVNPGTPEHVVIGTDGGVYRSLDGGRAFEMMMNLPISQFYHITVDDAEPFNVYGGLQDNGSWYGPSDSPGGIENKDWQITNWGDGFRVYRHPTDVNIIYAESQGGEIVRYDERDGQRKSIKPIATGDEPEYRFNWNTPIQLSPNNPERLYCAAQFLFRSEDRGDSWTKISPDLTTNDPARQRQAKSGGLSIDNSTAENNTTIYAVAESPKNEQIIWVGTDDGNIQVTTDGGATWANRVDSIAGLPKGLWVSHIEASRYDANTCYITVDGHKSGDKTPYVFKTTDLGETWQSLVTEDVEGFAHCIIEDTERSDMLFLGTEFGLFISMNSGTTWKRFDNGMPKKVGIRMMAMQERESALVIGTHGRGIYIIDDIQLLRQITPEIAAAKLHFFEQPPVYINYGRLSPPFSGAGNFRGSNPSKTVLSYYMKKRHTFGKMTAALHDGEGTFIKELKAGKSAGINTLPIPTRLSPPKSAPTNNRMALGGSLTPPPLAEGNYILKIKKGKDEFEYPFELKVPPNVLHSPEDRELARTTQMSLYNMTEQLAYMYDALGDLHTQAAARAEGVKKKKLKGKLQALATEVQRYKESLVSLEGDFYVDSSSSLREDISTLSLNISQYPGKPSSGQLAKTAELSERIEEVQTTFDTHKSTMEALNAALAKLDLEAMRLKTFEEFKAE